MEWQDYTSVEDYTLGFRISLKHNKVSVLYCRNDDLEEISNRDYDIVLQDVCIFISNIDFSNIHVYTNFAKLYMYIPSICTSQSNKYIIFTINPL